MAGRRAARGPAADGVDAPALRRALEERARAVGQVDLGVERVELDLADGGRLEPELHDRLLATPLLLLLERLDRVLAQLGAGGAAVLLADRGEEARGGRADLRAIAAAPAAAGQPEGEHREEGHGSTHRPSSCPRWRVRTRVRWVRRRTCAPSGTGPSRSVWSTCRSRSTRPRSPRPCTSRRCTSPTAARSSTAGSARRTTRPSTTTTSS